MVILWQLHTYTCSTAALIVPLPLPPLHCVHREPPAHLVHYCTAGSSDTVGYTVFPSWGQEEEAKVEGGGA